MHVETERLLIRDVQASDADGVHAWRSDPEVARFMDFGPASRAESERWLRECIQVNEAQPGVTICSIVLRATGDVIGWIGWGPADGEKADGGDVEFGYAMRRDTWGQGYGAEVLRTVIDYVLDVEGVDIFFGETDIQNHRSAQAMTRAGMEPMGVAPWDDTSIWFRARRSDP